MSTLALAVDQRTAQFRQTLLSPLIIGRQSCANRFFVQAMEGGDADDDGNATAKTYERYENLFRGESGMVSLEAISVTEIHSIRGAFGYWIFDG